MDALRLALLACAGLGMLATFAPWLEVEGLPALAVDGRSGAGWWTFAAFATAAAVVVRSVVGSAQERSGDALALAAGLGAAVLAWREIARARDAFAEATVEVGFGAWLAFLSGLGVAGLAFAGWRERRLEAEGER